MIVRCEPCDYTGQSKDNTCPMCKHEVKVIPQNTEKHVYPKKEIVLPATTARAGRIRDIKAIQVFEGDLPKSRQIRY